MATASTSASSAEPAMSYFAFCDICHCAQFTAGSLSGYITVSIIRGSPRATIVENSLKEFVQNVLIPLQNHAAQESQDVGIIIWEAMDMQAWAGGRTQLEIGIKLTVRYKDLLKAKSSVLRFGFNLAKEADLSPKPNRRMRRNTT